MIREIIKKRLSLSGAPQAELAEIVGINPAQMSLYLSGKSSLSHEYLEKLLVQMDINLNYYNERLELAEETAKALKGKRLWKKF
jgi:transcriptional regulator with XRE-family HTH domain